LSFLRKYLHANRSSMKPQIETPPNEHANMTHGSGGDWPELGLGADLVGGPELHAVDLRLLIAGGRQRATDHLVLVELRAWTKQREKRRGQTRREGRRRGNGKTAAQPERSLPCGRPFWRALETDGGGDLNLKTRWRRRGWNRRRRSIYI
jgi:hypothetical protein